MEVYMNWLQVIGTLLFLSFFIIPFMFKSLRRYITRNNKTSNNPATEPLLSDINNTN